MSRVPLIGARYPKPQGAGGYSDSSKCGSLCALAFMMATVVLVGCGQSVTPPSGIGGGESGAARAAVPTPAPPCTVAVPDGSVTITVSNTPALYADVAEPATTCQAMKNHGFVAASAPDADVLCEVHFPAGSKLVEVASATSSTSGLGQQYCSSIRSNLFPSPAPGS